MNKDKRLFNTDRSIAPVFAVRKPSGGNGCIFSNRSLTIAAPVEVHIGT